MQKGVLISCLAVAVVLGACTPSPTPPPPPSGPAGTAGPTINLTGKIVFEGTPPSEKGASGKAGTLHSGADPKCPKGIKAEDVVVSNGGLENVMVYISSGAEGKAGAAPSGAALFDQNGCQYVPHVLTVRVGQEVKIRNSDDTAHNVHTLPTKNPEINFGQPVKGAESTRKFGTAETFRVKCDIHPWMNATIGVFDHPFYAVSGTGGAYTMALPPGKYEVTAFHEKYGKKTAMVEVKEGVEPLNFTFKADEK